ncbi:MAG: Eco57I restriction-modification methylase domain-containing protein, partial [Promethearchaeota archaeon]
MDMHKNRFSQIFTPDYIAEFMVKNIKQHYFFTHNTSTIDKIKILEPSAGKGIFLNYILDEGFTDVTAYELDQTLKTSLLKNYPNVRFNFENFLGSDANKKFDIIIGNPPYLGQNYNAHIFQ